MQSFDRCSLYGKHGGVRFLIAIKAMELLMWIFTFDHLVEKNGPQITGKDFSNEVSSSSQQKLFRQSCVTFHKDVSNIERLCLLYF